MPRRLEGWIFELDTLVTISLLVGWNVQIWTTRRRPFRDVPLAAPKHLDFLYAWPVLWTLLLWMMYNNISDEKKSMAEDAAKAKTEKVEQVVSRYDENITARTVRLK